MALTSKQRDKIPAEHFAVPETKQLPINDEVHTRMAWQMVDRTKGLSDAQRQKARDRILKRAKELGMDTSNWDIKASEDDNGDFPKDTDYEMEKEQEEHEQRQDELNAQAITFSALAMEIPDKLSNHPNQTPFKGVLTRVDEPSNNPLHGSDGKCVVLPKDVAEKALSSLLGMAVDCTQNLDAHDIKNKIGIITAANIVGNEIQIQGFFYGADFPEEVKRIQAEKSQLGFSYEAQAFIRSMNDDPLVIKNCVFTGAAVLYKDKAAYTSTSLSAKKMEKDIMTPELKKMLEDMQAKIESLQVELAAAKEAKEDSSKLNAGSIQHMVKPHAEALRNAAAGMAAAGIGMHPKAGHVAMLHNMADNMEAEAVMGKMPHVYQTPDFFSAYASADDKSAAKESDATNNAVKALQTSLSEISTELADLKAAKFAAASEPQRKTLDPAIMNLLARKGIGFANDDSKLSMNEVDKVLTGSNLSVQQRIQIKHSLAEAGKIN